ncbi:mannosyltransferase [Spirochaetia bacterium]|nr:mannosyltransferase [Spirochaetia bacterium]
MKIFVVNSKNRIKNGQETVTQRNMELLKQHFGYTNICEYNIYNYSSKFFIFLYSLIGYCGGLTPKMKKHIRTKVLLGNYDYLFIDSSGYSSLVKYLQKYIKIIVMFHNVEVNIFLDKQKNIFFLKKLGYIPIIGIMFYSEMMAIKYSNKVITLNKRDSDELFRIYKRKADYILPVSLNDSFDINKAELYDKVDNTRKILFVGGDFFGNTEGLFWFIEECMNEINAELIIVGHGMERYQNKYQNKKVQFVGYVSDIGLYYYDADVVVLPIISGSGMKTKTCEALMYGKTMFGTTEAFEGYDYLDVKNNGWLCNTADEFIFKINKYLDEKHSKINIYSRQVFINNYETSKLVSAMAQIFS